MTDIRHSHSLEIERRIKYLISQSTDVLKERLAKKFILVITSVSTVHDNFYINSTREISIIHSSSESFIDMKRNNLGFSCNESIKLGLIGTKDLKERWVSLILHYDCPYFGRKYKSEIKKALSTIITFDKNCFSIIFEEKDSVVNMYYWIRLTNDKNISNDNNVWVKSRTLNFKNDELFCSGIKEQMKVVFGHTIEDSEVTDNFEEIMELLRMKNY